MRHRDRVLLFGRSLLRAILFLNWISLAVFVAVLLATLIVPGPLEARLAAKYGSTLDVDRTIMALRVLMLEGLVAFSILRIIATRLLAMIDTVAAGDPFIAANGRRLTVIGWALLAWQLLDLAVGAMTVWFERLGVDHAGWSPTLTGWVVTAMVFVLARVFAVGAAMRDELDGTV